MVEIKLTGILIGSEAEGYTSFFREIPFISAEGNSKKEAQINLFETIKFATEYMNENFIDDQEDRPYQEFNANLTLA